MWSPNEKCGRKENKQESCAIAKMTAQCALQTPSFGEGEAVGGPGWYLSKERW